MQDGEHTETERSSLTADRSDCGSVWTVSSPRSTTMTRQSLKVTFKLYQKKSVYII